jgi:hypothetical protein
VIYNLDSYPPSDSFLGTVENDVPESLKLLLETINKKKHKNSEEKFTDSTKVTAIAHCLIAAARPRSFFSPLQISLGSFLHRQFSSKHVLDLLSTLGFCSSYSNVRPFEVSCLKTSQERTVIDSFSQFIFDKATYEHRNAGWEEHFSCTGRNPVHYSFHICLFGGQ